MASKLFVGSLPYTVTNDELQNMFAGFGTVVSAVVINDRDTGRSKGFGFVEFSTDEEAEAAIKALHDTEVGGRRIIVNHARPMEKREGGFKPRFDQR